MYSCSYCTRIFNAVHDALHHELDDHLHQESVSESHIHTNDYSTRIDYPPREETVPTTSNVELNHADSNAAPILQPQSTNLTISSGAWMKPLYFPKMEVEIKPSIKEESHDRETATTSSVRYNNETFIDTKEKTEDNVSSREKLEWEFWCDSCSLGWNYVSYSGFYYNFVFLAWSIQIASTAMSRKATSSWWEPIPTSTSTTGGI